MGAWAAGCVSATRPSVAISAEQLTKRFANPTALDGLTLEIPVGDVFGFRGPQWCREVDHAALAPPASRADVGSAQIMGADVRDVREVHRHPVYVPRDVRVWPKRSGGQCLELFANLRRGVDVDDQAAFVFVVSSVHVRWDDENDGLLDLVVAGPIGRVRWLSAQTEVTAVAAIALATMTGVAT